VRPAERLGEILDTLESFYGTQAPRWPTEPYRFLVWWHCGYPASEERCGRGWESLNEKIGIAPEKLLATPRSGLARALKSGGLIPELRAGRLKEIAQRVQEEFDGNLQSALSRVALNHARALLKRFPGIADPGADRILLFGGYFPVAAIPSSSPHVLVRIDSGRTHQTYKANYREAREIIETQLAGTFAARTRAYLLLQQHGQQLCKRSSPQCGICPVASSCNFLAATSRKRSARAARR
jgi:endonuclease-3